MRYISETKTNQVCCKVSGVGSGACGGGCVGDDTIVSVSAVLVLVVQFKLVVEAHWFESVLLLLILLLLVDDE